MAQVRLGRVAKRHGHLPLRLPGPDALVDPTRSQTFWLLLARKEQGMPYDNLWQAVLVLESWVVHSR